MLQAPPAKRKLAFASDAGNTDGNTCLLKKAKQSKFATVQLLHRKGLEAPNTS